MKLGLAALQILLVYIVSWHVSFLLMFWSRGDLIDFELYRSYLSVVFRPETEIPSFIQMFAILMTGIYLLIRWAVKSFARRT